MTQDDLRTAALWQAADRALALYRLYAEEMIARSVPPPGADTARVAGQPPRRHADPH